MSSVPCPDCHGERLKPEYLAVTVGGKNISEFCKMSVTDALNFVEGLHLTSREADDRGPRFSRRSRPGWASSRAWAWST